MKEILVHISAPTSRKDDEYYRKLARAYDDFEPATTIVCTAKADEKSTLSPAPEYGYGQHISRQSRREDEEAGTATHNQELVTSQSVRGVIEDVSVGGANEDSPVAVAHTPLQHAASAKKFDGKDKTPENLAQAPDFGSFISSSRTPIEKLDEAQRRWFQQQQSAKRPASRLSNAYTVDPGDVPVFIEDTQQALAALEDHIAHSSFGDVQLSSPEEPSGAERSCKRPRMSLDASLTNGNNISTQQNEDSLNIPPLASPSPPRARPRTPPQNSMSSQMPDDYNLSNSMPSSSPRESDSPASFPNARVSDETSRLAFDEINPNHPEMRSPQPRDEAQDHEMTTEASLPLQAPTQQEMENVQPAAPQSGNEIPVSDVTPDQVDSATPAPTQAVGFDFASLPLQLWSTPPQTGKTKDFNAVTDVLELYVRNASIEHHYRPASISRPVKDTERGCWMFDTSSWAPRYQHEFWTRMQYLLGMGYLDNIWCQRNVAEQWELDQTDGREKEGLGVVWVFCWGQVIAHVWIMLLVESHKEIRKSKARWTVGPMERLEVVVQMP